MAPIRAALIGLSASAKTGWASGAHLPYLLSPRGLARYQIVALCNSSTAAARAAISAFNLPSETRAYGSPADLAADADVELVICCTRVDVHHETVRPSLAAGKMVYCEWPLAQDLEHVRDLAQLAREKQVRTMVAVQGRVAPSVKKLRELLEHGRIGKVVSAEVRAAGGLNDREILPKNLEYFTKREVGGNVFTIGFGHLWDQIQFVHGDASALQSRLHLQFPNSKIRDPETNIVKTVQSDVPDLIIVTSSLEESAIAQKEATLLVRFRRGQPSFDEPALLWSIIGEKGEIRLTNSGGTGMQATGDTASVRLVVQDFATNKVEQIEWQWEAWQEDLPLYARSVGALYEAFSEGAEKSYPTFEDALKRHEQLDGMLAAWAA
ncbi:hypothetical protein B0H17DRAFT_1074570 [Mycena rosella]|uniref:Gfo/Idh/MocA-like oxidoreductase N-terminal domain-containing protein n=1 Tax=Mycena rosella TaxID=1033263 RepID=A0AAD7D8S3_MYCRO|nr:hypothetical protein B0H17DRAFT_1074570 [Mycena rosella]